MMKKKLIDPAGQLLTFVPIGLVLFMLAAYHQNHKVFSEVPSAGDAANGLIGLAATMWPA